MRDYTGIPVHAEEDSTRRNSLGTIDYYLRDLSAGIARIQKGEIPDGSGGKISDAVLSDIYLVLLGRSENQVAHGGKSPSGTLTLSSTTDDTKGDIFLGADKVSRYDELDYRMGINIDPTANLHVKTKDGRTAGTQNLLPSDSTGSWGVVGDSAHEATDDPVGSNDGDTSYVTTSNQTGLSLELKVGLATDTGVYTGWKLHIVAKKGGAGAPQDMRIELWVNRSALGSGGTQIHSETNWLSSRGPLTESYVDYTMDLDSDDASSIALSTFTTLIMVGLAAQSEEIRVTQVYISGPGPGTVSANTVLERVSGQTEDMLRVIPEDGMGDTTDRFLTIDSSGTVGMGNTAAGDVGVVKANMYASGSQTADLFQVFIDTAQTMGIDEAGRLELFDSTGANSITHDLATGGAAYELIWPHTQGAANEVLAHTATPGTLDWVTITSLLDVDLTEIAAVENVQGDLLYTDATPEWNRLAIGGANTALITDGTDPSWGKVDLTTTVTGILPAANGGTGVDTSSFTAGSVIFSDGTNLAEDNANLFWDDSNNRLGIGTATPTAQLHVVSSGAAEEVFLGAGEPAGGTGSFRGFKLQHTVVSAVSGDGSVGLSGDITPDAGAADPIGTFYGTINTGGLRGNGSDQDINQYYSNFFRTTIYSSYTGTVKNAYTIRAQTPSLSGVPDTGNEVNNMYGVYVSNHGATGVGTAIGLYVVAQAGAGVNYEAIFAGTAGVGIGTTSPIAALDVDGGAVFNKANGSDDIIFHGASDNLLYLDTSADRVGIGTATPDKLLHLEAVTAANLKIENTGAATTRLEGYAARTGAGQGVLSIDGYWGASNQVARIILLTGDDTVNDDDGQIVFYTSASGSSPSERVRIDQDGYVGVGTPTPAHGLHVAPSVTGGSAYVMQVGGATDAIRGARLSPVVTSSTNGFGGVDFAPRVAPGAAVATVYGQIGEAIIDDDSGGHAITNFHANYYRLTTDANQTGTISSGRTLTLAAPTLSGTGPASMHGLVVSDQSNAKVTNAFGVLIDAQNTTGSGTSKNAGVVIGESANATYNSNLVIGGTTAPNGDFAFFSDSAKDSYFEANVGIGTGATSPVALLDVRGAAVFNEDEGDNNFRIAGLNLTNTFFVDASTGKIGLGTATPTAHLEVSVPVGSNPVIRLVDADAVTDNETPVTGHWVDVGFDPSLPDNAIGQFGHASSTTGGVSIVGLTEATSNAGNPLRFSAYHGGTAPTAPAIHMVSWKHDGGTDRTALADTERVFFATNGTNSYIDPLLAILGNGKVGLGEEAPRENLHVVGDIVDGSNKYSAILIQTDSTGSDDKAYLKFLVSTNDAAANDGAHILFNRTNAVSAADGDLEFWTRNTGTIGRRMVIDSAGNVGIGTASPTALLDVDGAAVFNNSEAAVDFRVAGNTETNLLFVDGSADRVGIGTATPQARFHSYISGGTITGVTAAHAMIFQRSSSTSNARAAIVAASNGLSALDFGNESDVALGSITYTHSGNLMSFDNNGVVGTITSGGYWSIGSETSPEQFIEINETESVGGGGEKYAACLRFDPGYTSPGAHAITIHNYMELQNPTTDNPTIADAAVVRFDDTVANHHALVANAAVAVTLGSTGPTGSTAGAPQGWMKINVNGTLRYIPFW